MKPLTIGKLAERAGVGIETVRFYERKGLLEAPDRRPSGHRQYDEPAVSRLRFIRRAKQLGFTLNEIGELLSLRTDPAKSCADMKSRAEQKLSDINSKIRALQKMKKALLKLTNHCSGRGPTSQCPILDSLDHG